MTAGRFIGNYKFMKKYQCDNCGCDEDVSKNSDAGIIASRTGINRIQMNIVADKYQIARREILSSAKGYVDDVINICST